MTSADEEMSQLFKSMKGIKILTADEERVLLQRAKTGDTDARQKLVWHNMPMVIKEAARMVRHHHSMSSDKVELMQAALAEGSMGICRAVAAFNLTLGNKFSTYAMWHIQEGIRRALVFDKNSVKPVRTLERARDVDISITMISFIEDFDKEDAANGETVGEELSKQAMIKELSTALRDILTTKERYIIEHRYGFHGTELTYGDLADMLGISTERIRQIENNALRKMWSYLRHSELTRLEERSAPAIADALSMLRAKTGLRLDEQPESGEPDQIERQSPPA